MKASLAAALLLAACGSRTTEQGTTTASSPTTAPKLKAHRAPADDDKPPGEIITDKVVAMQKGVAPSKDFRKGSVDPITPPKPQKTSTGFQVVFGHSAVTTPTVYEHEVIVSGGFSAKELYAYEIKTGKPLWGIDLHDDGPSSSACEDGTCVINTESCTIFAVDAKTGKQQWSYWLGDPLTSAPTVAQGRVFAAYPAGAGEGGKAAPAGANHVLAAFELKTGKVLWQLWLDGDVMSAPVAVGEFVYVSTFAGTVVKLEQATGKVRYATKVKATSAPVIQFNDDGVESMYYTRRGETEKDGAEEMLIRADHNEPQTKYKAASKKADYIDRKVQSTSAQNKKAKSDDANNGFGGGAPSSAAANYAFDSVGVESVQSIQGFQGSRVLRFRDKNVNTMGDEVVATDSDTGNTLWKFKLSGDSKSQGGFLGTAPLAAGNSVLLGTLDGRIVKLDPKTGTAATTFTVGSPVRSQPVVDDGWIYVGTDDGKLIAIDTKDSSLTGWPTWGGNAQRTGVAIAK